MCSRVRTKKEAEGVLRALPEESCVLHVLGIIVIGLLCPYSHPEEVLRFLAFIDDLWEGQFSPKPTCSGSPAHLPPPHLFAVGGVKHGVQNVFCQFGFVGV